MTGDAPARFDLLRWVPIDRRAEVTAELRRTFYDAGRTIYTQGEPGDRMYRVVSGSVRLSVRREDGREIVVLLKEADDWFGDSSLIDGEPRPQNAEALTPVTLEMLDRAGFKRLRASGRWFDEALLQLLARQMRAAASHYIDASLNDLRARVAARIVELATTRHGELAIRLAQSELAAMVGASRQSVNKTLQAFQREKLLTLDYGCIRVRNLGRLQGLTTTAPQLSPS